MEGRHVEEEDLILYGDMEAGSGIDLHTASSVPLSKIQFPAQCKLSANTVSLPLFLIILRVAFLVLFHMEDFDVLYIHCYSFKIYCSFQVYTVKETKMPKIGQFELLVVVMSQPWTHLYTSAYSLFTYGRFFSIQQLDLSIDKECFYCSLY